MIRVVVEQEFSGAAQAGIPNAKIHYGYRTFDIEAPELEAFLRKWASSSVIGTELLDE